MKRTDSELSFSFAFGSRVPSVAAAMDELDMESAPSTAASTTPPWRLGGVSEDDDSPPSARLGVSPVCRPTTLVPIAAPGPLRAREGVTQSQAPLSAPLARLRSLPLTAASSDLCSAMAPLGADVDEIIPGLFLGGWKAAADAELVSRCGFSSVLNLCDGDTPFEWQDRDYHVLGWPRVERRLDVSALDEPSYPLFTHFAPATAFIDGAEGGRILVHCKSGVSRSAAVVIAYLMQRHRLTFADAESLVVSRRAGANPNFGFREQLVELEQQLLAAEGVEFDEHVGPATAHSSRTTAMQPAPTPAGTSDDAGFSSASAWDIAM